MNARPIVLAVCLAALGLLCAVASPAFGQVVDTPTPAPSETPSPTDTPAPAPTTVPTTPEPTATLEPTATPTPGPTLTPAPTMLVQIDRHWECLVTADQLNAIDPIDMAVNDDLYANTPAGEIWCLETLTLT